MFCEGTRSSCARQYGLFTKRDPLLMLSSKCYPLPDFWLYQLIMIGVVKSCTIIDHIPSQAKVIRCSQDRGKQSDAENPVVSEAVKELVI